MSSIRKTFLITSLLLIGGFIVTIHNSYKKNTNRGNTRVVDYKTDFESFGQNLADSTVLINPCNRGAKFITYNFGNKLFALNHDNRNCGLTFSAMNRTTELLGFTDTYTRYKLAKPFFDTPNPETFSPISAKGFDYLIVDRHSKHDIEMREYLEYNGSFELVYEGQINNIYTYYE